MTAEPERPTLEEAEIQVALAAGVLAAGEADVLKAEARDQARGPLMVLLRKGRLSDETFASATFARTAPPGIAPPSPGAAPRSTRRPTRRQSSTFSPSSFTLRRSARLETSSRFDISSRSPSHS